jgi:hypothetical protein
VGQCGGFYGGEAQQPLIIRIPGRGPRPRSALARWVRYGGRAVRAGVRSGYAGLGSLFRRCSADGCWQRELVYRRLGLSCFCSYAAAVVGAMVTCNNVPCLPCLPHAGDLMSLMLDAASDGDRRDSVRDFGLDSFACTLQFG